jgi:hypothetical protein
VRGVYHGEGRVDPPSGFARHSPLKGATPTARSLDGRSSLPLLDERSEILERVPAPRASLPEDERRRRLRIGGSLDPRPDPWGGTSVPRPSRLVPLVLSLADLPDRLNDRACREPRAWIEEYGR